MALFDFGTKRESLISITRGLAQLTDKADVGSKKSHSGQINNHSCVLLFSCKITILVMAVKLTIVDLFHGMDGPEALVVPYHSTHRHRLDRSTFFDVVNGLVTSQKSQK